MFKKIRQVNPTVHIDPFMANVPIIQKPTNCFDLYYGSICLTPASIYLFKVSNENHQTISEICSKITIKAPERRLEVVLLS